MIIPEGYDVKGGEGLKIDLTNSAKILSFSPLHFTGSEESPINIFSSDTTGQGIIVINANAGSLMEYVHFINLSYPAPSGGKITFLSAEHMGHKADEESSTCYRANAREVLLLLAIDNCPSSHVKS